MSIWKGRSNEMIALESQLIQIKDQLLRPTKFYHKHNAHSTIVHIPDGNIFEQNAELQIHKPLQKVTDIIWNDIRTMSDRHTAHMKLLGSEKLKDFLWSWPLQWTHSLVCQLSSQKVTKKTRDLQPWVAASMGEDLIVKKYRPGLLSTPAKNMRTLISNGLCLWSPSSNNTTYAFCDGIAWNTSITIEDAKNLQSELVIHRQLNSDREGIQKLIKTVIGASYSKIKSPDSTKGKGNIAQEVMDALQTLTDVRIER